MSIFAGSRVASHHHPAPLVPDGFYLDCRHPDVAPGCPTEVRSCHHKCHDCHDVFLVTRCIIWDLSRSFLLRLAITIFSIILIYTMAQVNVVSGYWVPEADDYFDLIKYLQFTCQREALASCEPKPSAKIQNHPGHRWCPLPHYILISCMLR